MSISIINIGVRRHDGYIHMRSTLNNFQEEFNKDEFGELIDQLLRMYQSVGVAVEVFIIDTFQNSGEYLYADKYPPQKWFSFLKNFKTNIFQIFESGVIVFWLPCVIFVTTMRYNNDHTLTCSRK